MSEDLIKRSDAIKAFTFNSKGERIPFVDCDNFPVEFPLRYIVDTLVALLPADRPRGEWIPCSERLPEEEGEYHISEPCIVYCKGGVYAFAELEENIFGQVGWNCERDDDYHEPIGEVVAWMPLPKPYGEREGE